MTTLRLEIDQTADCAYVYFSNRKTVKTIEVSPEVLVDMDEFNVAVGIEMLRLDAQIPFEKLASDFHMPSEAIEDFRKLRPSIQSLFERASIGEGTSNEVGRSVAR